MGSMPTAFVTALKLLLISGFKTANVRLALSLTIPAVNL